MEKNIEKDEAKINAKGGRKLRNLREGQVSTRQEHFVLWNFCTAQYIPLYAIRHVLLTSVLYMRCVQLMALADVTEPSSANCLISYITPQHHPHKKAFLRHKPLVYKNYVRAVYVKYIFF
jgi:hypothetical protein